MELDFPASARQSPGSRHQQPVPEAPAQRLCSPLKGMLFAAQLAYDVSLAPVGTDKQCNLIYYYICNYSKIMRHPGDSHHREKGCPFLFGVTQYLALNWKPNKKTST